MISQETTALSGCTFSVDGGVSLISKTPIFGQKLYVTVSITVIIVTVILVMIVCCIGQNINTERCRRLRVKQSSRLLPIDGEIKESKFDVFVKDDDRKEEIRPIIRVVQSKIGGTDSGSNEYGKSRSEGASSSVLENLSGLGWGRWYSLSGLGIATSNFVVENAIGGGHGVVYRGVLLDGYVVAV